jgi:hypothetical protein
MVNERCVDMRTVHWLFVVSVALFLSGIGFVIASARSIRDAPSVAGPPVTLPVATVKQIMDGIVMPAAAAVFDSVAATVTDAGIDEKFPRTDAEWAAVGNSAAALAEAGNLLMLEGHAVDKGEWIKMSQAMIEGAKVALKAIESKNKEALLDAGGTINVTCDNCHRTYQRG